MSDYDALELGQRVSFDSFLYRRESQGERRGTTIIHDAGIMQDIAQRLRALLPSTAPEGDAG